jgi:UDP-N-acetylglucosamine transferase subunit ALG13
VSTLVSVGNATQPFARLLQAVCAILPRLPQPVIVQHGSTPFAAAQCRAMRFMEMAEFDRLVRDASLVIIHAGAGSVIHAVRAGKVPVVMPRRARDKEAVDNHQVEFALQLEGLGRVVLAREAQDLERAVASALERQARNSNRAEPPLMLQLVRARIEQIAASQKGARLC